MKNVTCKVELAGSSAYILASGTYKGKHYMIDLSGIENSKGFHPMRLSVSKYNGNKMLKTYSAKGKVEVLIHPKDKKVRYIATNGNLRSKDGGNLQFSMGVSWYKSALPSSSKNLNGKLSQKFGNTNCKASKTKIQPWNDGYQIQKLFLIKAGETATTTLYFPKLKAGVYKGKNAKNSISTSNWLF